MQKQELLGEDVFVVHDFLTAEECAAYIAASEQQGYEDAPITMGDSAIVIKDYRDNLRVMVDDVALAADLFVRARPFLPALLQGRHIVGLNERLRYYRYDVGQTFAPHYDGSFQRNAKEQSLLTFMVYLNAEFSGGTTDFYDAGTLLRLRVQPEQGMALVFRHELLHGGAAVTSGRKYVLRTDVMYRSP
jgi:predicted 2-oxoglutarate/Fe(II)-dependent dioxygenase YbiX